MKGIESYRKVFMDVFEVDETALGESFTQAGTEKWDSVTQMALVAAIEQAFDIMLDIDDIYELNSYEKGKEIIKKYGVEL